MKLLDWVDLRTESSNLKLEEDRILANYGQVILVEMRQIISVYNRPSDWVIALFKLTFTFMFENIYVSTFKYVLKSYKESTGEMLVSLDIILICK